MTLHLTPPAHVLDMLGQSVCPGDRIVVHEPVALVEAQVLGFQWGKDHAMGHQVLKMKIQKKGKTGASLIEAARRRFVHVPNLTRWP